MKNNVTAWVVIAALASSSSSNALAWGEQGHKTIAAIAAQLIKGTPAEVQVNALLPTGSSLVSVSVWADCVKHPDNNYCAADRVVHAQEWKDLDAQAKGKSGNYHFTDIDPTMAYVYAATGGPDVVHGIAESIAVLRGDASVSNPSNLTKTQALWLLVHLVGDIHQPLHVGAIPVAGDVGATQGSNKLYPLAGECLHSDWDDEYVADAKRAIGLSSALDPDAYAHALLTKFSGLLPPSPPAAADPIATPVAWANDTLAIARDVALKNVNLGAKVDGTCGYGFSAAGWSITVPSGYEAKAAGQVDVQLWKAGQRLAGLLKAIWPSA